MTKEKMNTGKAPVELQEETIAGKIYVIRDQKVMLDKDLAELYRVTTGNLNKAVKRNMNRFPEDFMFQLNNEEFKNLIFQSGISSWGGLRKLPYVFTEQGVAMLSSVLSSDRAIEVNIQIMRIFTRFRKTYLDATEIRLEIEKLKKKMNDHSKDSEIIFHYLNELNSRIDELEIKKQEPVKRLGFKP